MRIVTPLQVVDVYHREIRLDVHGGEAELVEAACVLVRNVETGQEIEFNSAERHPAVVRARQWQLDEYLKERLKAPPEAPALPRPPRRIPPVRPLPPEPRDPL